MAIIRNIETDLEFENKIRPQELSSFSGQDTIVDNPVSYTHIDVYKRQKQGYSSL